MGIEISISCSTHRCKSTMSENDEVYCADCMASLTEENKGLQSKIENLEEEVCSLEADLAEALAAAYQLKEIIKACLTCSATLVAKNL